MIDPGPNYREPSPEVWAVLATCARTMDSEWPEEDRPEGIADAMADMRRCAEEEKAL